MKRFVDASTFLYAILEPQKKIPTSLKKLKDGATQILIRINKGEAVVTSVVHLSEVANILEARQNLEQVSDFMRSLMLKESLLVLNVTKSDYQAAAVLAKRYKVGINDALAKILMEQNDITEIYSFDKHFDNFKLKRIAK